MRERQSDRASLRLFDDRIKQRQRVYWKQTAPLLEYYKDLNLLKNVNGIGEIEQITKRILKAID